MPRLDKSVCRVCLHKKGTDAVAEDKFQYCTALKIAEGDGLPQKLCPKCSDNLRVAYDFRYQATCAQKHFHDMLKDVQDDYRLEEQRFSIAVARPSAETEIGNTLANDMQRQCTDNEDEVLADNDNHTDDRLTDHSSEDFQRIAFVAAKTAGLESKNVSKNAAQEHLSEFQRDLGSMLKHNGKIECNICGSVSASIYTLKAHFLTHCGLRPFHCTVCNKRFVRHSILKNHMRIHTGNFRHACELCGATFASKISMLRHKIRDHDSKRNNQRKYTCALCHVEHTSKYALNGHMRLHLKQMNESALQPLPALSKGEGEMGLYQKAQINELSRFTCLAHDCQQSFDRKYQLLAHLQSHAGAQHLTQRCLADPSAEHLDEAQMQRAPIGQSAANSSGSGQAPAAFVCDCKKAFARRDTLNLHRQLHGDHKPLSCLLCAHAQHSIADLLAHMRGAHPSECHNQRLAIGPSSNYTCTLCGYSFYALTSYMQHLDRHNRRERS